MGRTCFSPSKTLGWVPQHPGDQLLWSEWEAGTRGEVVEFFGAAGEGADGGEVGVTHWAQSEGSVHPELLEQA
jgi:hypothetical protein